MEQIERYPGEDFEIVEAMRQYESVWKIRRKIDDKIFLLKKTPNLDGDSATKLLLNAECRLLQACQSPFNVKLDVVFKHSDCLFIVIEFIEGEDLSKIIKHQHYTEDFIKYTIWSVANGLKVLHENNVVHRNLRPENILCNGNGSVKVSDFANSRILTSDSVYTRRRLSGAWSYMPPEVLSG